jgi:hypothetical protein
MAAAPVIDLLAYNNTRGTFSRDVSTWAEIYDLATAEWRLQVRRAAEKPTALLELSTTGGTAAYAAGIVVFTVSAATMARLDAGSYVWDFGFVPAGGDFVRCGGGAYVVEAGVTR